MTGWTDSTDFPTAGTTTAFAGNYDAFVTKIDKSGASLSYSTYLGGSLGDYGQGIAVDSAGNAYVTGYTSSFDFPEKNAIYGIYNGVQDAFVAKIAALGVSLSYSTYLGGSNKDNGYGIAVDSAGNAYVAGETWSTNFPTTLNAINGSLGGSRDAFVAKIAALGTSISYSTYLGGSLADSGYAIAVDSAGNAYVTGYTDSIDFPTASAIYGTKTGFIDAFVTKIDKSGTSISYSTYLGGSLADTGRAIAVDNAGNAYVTGDTSSTDFPTLNAIGGNYNGGNLDAFVTKIAALGTNLAYSTYLGGSSDDYGQGIAVDSAGSAYVTGWTHSTDFPTAGTTTGYAGGDWDAFVTKIAEPLPECKLKKITTVKNPPQLVQGESGTITVTLTGKKGCKSAGKTVTAKIASGKTLLAISPASLGTDSEGVAEFTMTAAANKKGVATVRFKTEKLKKDVKVKVKKGA